MSNPRLDDFNRAALDTARELLLACCASRRWADAVVAARPFDSFDALVQQARQVWQGVADADRLEAFTAHPRIGDVELLRARFAQQGDPSATALGDRTHAEQGQVLEAPESVIEELAVLNQRYLARHGFLFIVCASGKSAVAMLELLRGRIDRTTEEEMHTAAAEQMKITELRMAEAFA